MNPEVNGDGPSPERTDIHTRHPGIGNDIEQAIRTLRKLQEITGTIVVDFGGVAGSEPGSGATLDVPTPSGEDASQATARLPRLAAAAAGNAREPALLVAGESFGRYQIVRLLGRGGMGAVYLAYDSQLQRHLALKTPFLGSNPTIIERFFREARATAQLRSPYICPVFDVGQIGGIHYLSMAFIEGRPLSRVLADGGLTDAQAISDLTNKVARGIHKAHERGIIHRDLKPDNIMIDAEGEPVIMDFGLARQIEEDIRLTSPGKILGTPAYMSPEQAEGDSGRMGPATDIYSLGVVLYEMLTGRLPFHGSLTSVLRQIASVEPRRPSAVNPRLGVDSPLERICLKMMAKSPESRYRSMAEVVAALEGSCLEGVVARAPARKGLWSRSIELVASLSRRGKSARAPEPKQAGESGAEPSRGTCADSSALQAPTQSVELSSEPGNSVKAPPQQAPAA